MDSKLMSMRNRIISQVVFWAFVAALVLFITFVIVYTQTRIKAIEQKLREKNANGKPVNQNRIAFSVFRILIPFVFISLWQVTFSQTFTKVAYTLQNTSVGQSSLASGVNDFDWGDYDGDGDFDIILTGQLSEFGSKGGRIFRNDGSDVFYDIRFNFPYMSNGMVQWGDFDNDGDLDAFYAGGDWDFPLDGNAQLVQNNGGDDFNAVATSFPRVLDGRVALEDYDRDGLLDVAYSGRKAEIGVERIAYLYRNKGNWLFEKVDTEFIQVSNGELQWIDYNNDGWQDLFIAGTDNSGEHTKLYRNTDGEFQEVPFTFPGLSKPKVSWADYDADGYPDLLMLGNDDESYLFRNNGDDTFTETGDFLDLYNIAHPSFADTDTDGDIDIIGGFINESLGHQIKIFSNNGNGTFTPFVPEVNNYGYFSRVAWFDYDGDNKMDISFQVSSDDGENLEIWKSTAETVNTPPTVPSGLAHVIDDVNNTLTLSWEAASDNETAAELIEYNVRVGTSEGAQDFYHSGAQPLTGKSFYTWKQGNAGKSTTLVISNFKDRGNFYWSVQSVDQNKGRSQFAEEVYFRVENEAPVIYGQKPINIVAATSNSVNVTLDHLYFQDPDNVLEDLLLTLVPDPAFCSNYSVSGTTITEVNPSTLPCRLKATLHDGTDVSNEMTIVVGVQRDTNPRITGQRNVKTVKNMPLGLQLNHLTYTNEASVMHLVVFPGLHYSVSGQTITPDDDFTGTLKIPVMLAGTKWSDIFEFSLPVIEASENAAPVITGQHDISINEDATTPVSPGSLIIEDADNTDPLDFSIIILPGENYTTSSSSITPAHNYSGHLEVAVKVSDGISESNVFYLDVSVTPVNDAPVTTPQFFYLTATMNETFSFTLPPGYFSDPDGDELTYLINDYAEDASWLSFDPLTKTLSGTPLEEQFNIGYYLLEIIATDPSGESVSSDFNLDIFVLDYNTPPYLFEPVDDQLANPGEPYSYTTISYAFLDDETPTLSYTVTGEGGTPLPAWLNFNPWTLELSGTPTVDDAGTITLEVTAYDQSGLSVSTTFEFTVSGTPPSKNVTAIQSPDPVEVPFGTVFTAIPRPGKVWVTYDNGNGENLAVVFSDENYDPNVPATYFLDGEIAMPPNTTNTGALMALLEVNVEKQDQSISFGPVTTKTYGDDPFDLNASASSGLPVSYTSSDESVASISGSEVNILKPGTVIITASQNGDDFYEIASPVEQELVIEKADQDILFEIEEPKSYDENQFVLSGTASSGLDITYTSADESVAAITGNMVTLIGAGTTIITAQQTGNDYYHAASPVVQTLIVNKAAQTITFNPLDEKNFGDADFTLEAQAESGLPVSFSVSDESIAVVSGSTVSIVGAGTLTITASQAGNTNFASASATQTLTINKADQKITFNTIDKKVFGDADFTLEAQAESGLPVSFSVSDESIAVVSGSTVSIVGAGTLTITASQAGNTNFASASATQTLTISKADQQITFAMSEEVTFGDAEIILSGTSSSGLPVIFSSSNHDVATISDMTLTITGAGVAVITASQGGNSNYNPATLQRTLTAGKASQEIIFPALAEKTLGDPPVELSAVTSSGLPVTYTSSNENVATISGNTLTIVGAGETTITAIQKGDKNFHPATPAVHLLSVKRQELLTQKITFAAIPDKTIGDASFTLQAESSSGLEVVFFASNNKVAIAQDQVTLLEAGRVGITATQPGNQHFMAAAEVKQTFCINPPKPAITPSDSNEGLIVLTSSSPVGNQWYLNGHLLEGAIGKDHIAMEPGEYSVRVLADDCESVPSEKYAIQVTGVEQKNEAVSLTLYPNPADKALTIYGPSDTGTLRIFRSDGRIIKTIHTTENQTIIDVESFTPGIYLIILETREGRFTKWFVRK